VNQVSGTSRSHFETTQWLNSIFVRRESKKLCCFEHTVLAHRTFPPPANAMPQEAVDLRIAPVELVSAITALALLKMVDHAS
jgi:hypothetical protein